MLKVHSNSELELLEGFTEFEDDIHFDSDDPDFEHHHHHHHSKGSTGSLHDLFIASKTLALNAGTTLVSSKMSLASIHHHHHQHPANLHARNGLLTTLSHSLEDIATWGYNNNNQHNNATEAVLTIEELRDQLHCCFTCGVSWSKSHVSLDCFECGGYPLERPCPNCDGACGAIWKRDLNMSHASSKAKWTGECNKTKDRSNSPISHDLSKRLERLSATNNHDESS